MLAVDLVWPNKYFSWIKNWKNQNNQFILPVFWTSWSIVFNLCFYRTLPLTSSLQSAFFHFLQFPSRFSFLTYAAHHFYLAHLSFCSITCAMSKSMWGLRNENEIHVPALVGIWAWITEYSNLIDNCRYYINIKKIKST